MNDLAILERQLTPLAPQFAQVLGAVMPAERLIRTVLVSVERMPRLMQCDRQSLFNAAMSAACLGLEVDGVTGQAFIIPFRDRAQLVIGYKGFNTLAARSGFAIRGAVVREGDAFDYDLATADCHHKPKLGNKGRIIGAWARAVSNSVPALLAVLDIDALVATKTRSPGAKRGDSPWNDPDIGFPAMCEKTAKRRLARSMPLNVMQLGARMEEAFEEQGKHAWISPQRGVVIEGGTSPLPDRQDAKDTPSAQQLISPGPLQESATAGEAAPSLTQPLQDGAATPNENPRPAVISAINNQPLTVAYALEYIERWHSILDEAQDAKELRDLWTSEYHKDQRRSFEWPEGALNELLGAVSAKIKELQK